MTRSSLPAARSTIVVASALAAATPRASSFDHDYSDYAKILHDYVHARAWTTPRSSGVAPRSTRWSRRSPSRPLTEERGWTREQRLAFWINAYNRFTLRAIVDHYPIRSALFTLQPRNSIRQIDGVWTTLTWRAAGRTLTLDDIEHRILRPEFKEPRVHFAVNCASVGCPPLAAEPYRRATLDAQLDEAARRYLASERGLTDRRQHAAASRRSSKWYGDDFVARFAPEAAGAPIGSNARFEASSSGSVRRPRSISHGSRRRGSRSSTTTGR